MYRLVLAYHIMLLSILPCMGQPDTAAPAIPRNVILFGVFLLLVLLLLDLLRHLLKRRNDKRLLEKQDEIDQQKRSLQQLIVAQDKLLEEKEWLVREVHHRVRNNLQIVMSLLNTQAAYLHDADALEAISESKHRMQAISLIHQKLYQSGNMALIDMQTYIHELIAYLRDNFEYARRIHFDLQTDPVQLEVYQAVPVGLILNEALTNAIKHARTSDAPEPVVKVLLTAKDGQLDLAITGTGLGLPSIPAAVTYGSMGVRLMETLAEQLEGTISLPDNQGISVCVSFLQQTGS